MTPYVVCIGLATLDSIFRVPRHPAADDRVVATEHVTAGGGPAATAAATLARLGVHTFFAGAIGDDDAGREIRAGLEREGVDVSELRTVAGVRSPASTVLVGAGGRAIVHYPGTAPRAQLGIRARQLCAGAAWVHVDHAGYAAAPAGVRLSVDGGNPIDGLDLGGVDLYAPTERELAVAFGAPERALAAGAEVVVVTRGDRGSAGYTRAGEVVDAPARPVEAVSTLGAGDVFHGALLAELVRGAPLGEALERANACAALSCRGLDGRSAIPTLEEVAAP